MVTSSGSSIAINPSNIGFQVFPHCFIFRNAHCFYLKKKCFRCYFFLLLWSCIHCPLIGLMQLLKKHGWKEGTGLGISEQVIILLSFLLLFFFTKKQYNHKLWISSSYFVCVSFVFCWLTFSWIPDHECRVFWAVIKLTHNLFICVDFFLMLAENDCLLIIKYVNSVERCLCNREG